MKHSVPIEEKGQVVLKRQQVFVAIAIAGTLALLSQCDSSTEEHAEVLNDSRTDVVVNPKIITYHGTLALRAGDSEAVLSVICDLPAVIPNIVISQKIRKNDNLPRIQLIRGPDVSRYARPTGSPLPPLPDDPRYSKEDAIEGTIVCAPEGTSSKGRPVVSIRLENVIFRTAKVRAFGPITAELGSPPPP